MEFLRWKEPLGRPECPYCYRWVLNLGLFSIRLHYWVKSDDKRALHNHPYWFITFILAGNYYDVGVDKTEIMTAGTIRFRKASHTHTVILDEGKECWSFLVTGPKTNKWGFFLNSDRFLRSEKYFKRMGKHQCI